MFNHENKSNSSNTSSINDEIDINDMSILKNSYLDILNDEDYDKKSLIFITKNENSIKEQSENSVNPMIFPLLSKQEELYQIFQYLNQVIYQKPILNTSFHSQIFQIISNNQLLIQPLVIHILPFIELLMSCYLGSNFLKLFFTYLDSNQRLTIWKKITLNTEVFLSLCNRKYPVHSIQKLIEMSVENKGKYNDSYKNTLKNKSKSSLNQDIASCECECKFQSRSKIVDECESKININNQINNSNNIQIKSQKYLSPSNKVLYSSISINHEEQYIIFTFNFFLPKLYTNYFSSFIYQKLIDVYDFNKITSTYYIILNNMVLYSNNKEGVNIVKKLYEKISSEANTLLNNKEKSSQTQSISIHFSNLINNINNNIDNIIFNKYGHYLILKIVEISLREDNECLVIKKIKDNFYKYSLSLYSSRIVLKLVKRKFKYCRLFSEIANQNRESLLKNKFSRDLLLSCESLKK